MTTRETGEATMAIEASGNTAAPGKEPESSARNLDKEFVTMEEMDEDRDNYDDDWCQRIESTMVMWENRHTALAVDVRDLKSEVANLNKTMAEFIQTMKKDLANPSNAYFGNASTCGAGPSNINSGAGNITLTPGVFGLMQDSVTSNVSKGKGITQSVLEQQDRYIEPTETGIKELIIQMMEEMRQYRRNPDEVKMKEEVEKMSVSPLATHITESSFPEKFTMPRFKMYKGDTDPVQHMKSFKNSMAAYQHNHAWLCKAFASSLEGKSLDWFHELPTRSIQNFSDLYAAFLRQYSSCRESKKNVDHLFSIKKRSGETIKDYIRRFKEELASVSHVDDSVAAVAFKRGLPVDSTLYGSLAKKSDISLAESYSKAEKYAQWDAEKRRAGLEGPAKERASSN